MKITKSYLRKIIKESIYESDEEILNNSSLSRYSDEELLSLGQDLYNAMEELKKAGGPDGDPIMVGKAVAAVAAATQKHFKGSDSDRAEYDDVVKIAFKKFIDKKNKSHTNMSRPRFGTKTKKI